MSRTLCRSAFLALLCLSTGALAATPPALGDNVRYLSMGDSFAAGKGALPATNGFAYVLYQSGVFGSLPDITFANAAMPGTSSKELALYQYPQVPKFNPTVVTIHTGGNDLGKILGGADPDTVVNTFIANMTLVMCGLRDANPSKPPLVIVGNQPDYPWLSVNNPAVAQLIVYANQRLAAAALQCGARVADVYKVFVGNEQYYLHYRPGADPSETHPTNAGYRAMARAYEDAAKQ